MKKFLLAFVSLTFILSLALVNEANAATGTVNATVTIQNVSISVASGTVSYGTLAPSTSLDTSTDTGGLNDTQVVTNNGNVAEDFAIAGQNSTNWTLGATAGSNIYVQQFCISSCTTAPTNYTALTTSNQTLASNVAANGTQNLDLRITTPSSSTVTTQQSVNVTITATFH